jgi:hypothetical protein
MKLVCWQGHERCVTAVGVNTENPQVFTTIGFSCTAGRAVAAEVIGFDSAKVAGT